MDKMKMELVWHNCVTCQPEEDFVSGLYVTDGRGIFMVDWWRSAGYRNGNFVIDPTKDKSKSWWWSDLRQTTIGFFKKMK